MRHVTIEGIKFFSGTACINRPDGYRLRIYTALRGEPDHYLMHLVGPDGISLADCVWRNLNTLAAQAVINEFRKGGDFKEGTDA